MKTTIFLIRIKIIVLVIVTSITITFSQTVSTSENCTIGIAAGKATFDGRPLIWKTTDGTPQDMVVIYYDEMKYSFLGNTPAKKSGYTFFGLNERGLGIVESNAPDLETGSTGYGNFSFLWQALGTCAVIDDFVYLLDSTNITGRRTYANYAVIDTTGAAILFETAGSQYWKFDVNDTTVAPDGYLVRANFSINGGGSGGLDRFNRSSKLIADFYAGDSLNYKSILRYQMRDFSDWESEAIPVPYPDYWNLETPYGYIHTGASICGFDTYTGAVIQGVLPGDNAGLSTMWKILGSPAASIAVPYWPVGNTPELASNSPTARLSDIAIAIKKSLFDYQENENYIDTYKLRDEDGNGLWATTFPAEDSILTAAENKLQQWRTGSFSIKEMLATESEFAQYAYSKLRSAHDQFLTFNKANIVVSKVFSTYVEIAQDTLLTSGDDSQSVIELPFSFEYDGIRYDKIQVSTNGWLELGKGESGSDSSLSTSAQLGYVGAANNERLASTERPSKALAPWWDDLTTGSEGEISYKIVGNLPDRKLIVQWKNMQAYSSGTSTQLNFQVHLQETTNNIEFHYGPVTTGTYTGDGASIGFKDYLGGALRFYDLEEDKICYKDELISSLNPLKDWPGPDSIFVIETYAEPTAIDRIVSAIPKSSQLFQNYPNPFNPTTSISYQLSAVSDVELSIYNILGQKVAALVNAKQNAGNYSVDWNAAGFASGVYMCRLSTGSGPAAGSGYDFSQIKKLILLK